MSDPKMNMSLDEIIENDKYTYTKNKGFNNRRKFYNKKYHTSEKPYNK